MWDDWKSEKQELEVGDQIRRLSRYCHAEQWETGKGGDNESLRE